MAHTIGLNHRANVIVFVDSELPDQTTLLAGLPPDAEVFVVDATKDGLQQMADALAGRSGIGTIHLLCHGSAGALQVGCNQLNQFNLGDYASTLAKIGSTLCADGNIFLYGCNVAEGAVGRTFVDALAQFTGADVAASTDITGAGSNWRLEYATGAVDSAQFAIAEGFAGYQHTLNSLVTNLSIGSSGLTDATGTANISVLPVTYTTSTYTAGTSWRWVTTDRNGGGLTVDIPASALNATNYSVGVKFKLDDVNGTNNTYAKIIDYENRTSDNGFYLKNTDSNVNTAAISFFNGGALTPAGSISNGQTVDFLITRDNNSFKVYLDGNTTTPIYNLAITSANASTFAVPKTVNVGGVDYVRFGFFFDDTTFADGASPGGEVFGLRIWDYALDSTNIASALSAPPTTTIVSAALSADTGASNTDFITQTAAQTISGALSANLATGEKVQVSLNGGTTWVDATTNGTNWTVSTSLLAGSNVLKVHVVNGALAGPDYSKAYNLDTVSVAPAKAIISVDGMVNAAEKGSGIIVSGTAEADANVAVTWGSTTKNTQANTTGNWSTTFASTDIPGDGSSTVTAVATDLAGNVSTAATQAVLVDSLAPVMPVIDAIAADNRVNLAEKTAGVAVSGTAEANASVSVTWGTVTKTIAANATGVWAASFLSTEIPADGNTTVSVVATDAAGNTSTAATRGVLVDTSAPGTPTIAALTGDNIVSAADKAAGVTVNGTAEANASISVNWGTITKDVTANGSGAWSANFASTDVPLDGNTTVTAVATDSAGNTASTAATQAVLVDTTSLPPALTLVTDSGSSATDKITNNAQLSVSGLESGATWQYSVDAGVNWNTGTGSTANITGADGTKSVTVRQTDAQGNVSPASAPLQFTLDTTAPAAAVINAVTVDDRVNAAEKTTGQTVSGTAEANASVSVTWGTVTKTVTTGNTGSWSATFGNSEIPADGATTVSATVTDKTGNTGTAGTRAITVDTTVAKPTLALDQDTGSNTTDGITRNGRVNVTGLEAGATWEYSLNNGSSWSAGQRDSVTLSGDGAKSVLVRQTDLAGNVSANSSPLNFTLDTAATGTPIINLVAGDDQINATEKSAGVAVSGTATASSTVTVTWGGASQTATATGGVWTVTFPSGQIPTDGDSQISATAELAGSTSPAGTRRVLIDTAVATPTLALVTDTGASNTDKITSQGAIQVSGLEAGATWQYSTNGGTSWATGTGDRIQLSSDGVKSVTVRQTDAAGNVSTVSAPLALTLDTTAPTDPVINTVAGNDVVNAAERSAGVTVSGTAEANATIVVDWGTQKTVTADGTGAWSVVFASAEMPLDGPTDVIVTATDAAGNRGVTGKVVDMDATASVITAVLTADTGSNTADRITKNGEFFVTGLEPGASWQYSTDAGATWSASQAYSVTDSATLTGDGGKSVTVRQIDTSGNVGPASSPLNFMLDATAPNLPVIAAVAGDNKVNAAEKAVGVIINGTAEANASVSITWGATTKTTTANAAGIWTTSFATGQIPADGNTTASASATDTAGNVSTPATRGVTVDTAILLETPTVPVGSGSSNADGDNVPALVEDRVPGLPSGNGVIVSGDGNGDGIADSLQPEVSSAAFRLTNLISQNPNAEISYVTLVVSPSSETGGNPTGTASITAIRQVDAPTAIPSEFKLPLGLIDFTAKITSIGGFETFSLFVENNLGINGYWKQNHEATWVNLASEAFGGKIIEVGNKLRLNFEIQDGGEFDADHSADGIIVDPGAAGQLPVSLIGQSPDLPDIWAGI